MCLCLHIRGTVTGSNAPRDQESTSDSDINYYKILTLVIMNVYLVFNCADSCILVSHPCPPHQATVSNQLLLDAVCL